MNRRFPWISDDVLRHAAGSKTFDRGAAYCTQGRVDLLSRDATRVLARVRGSEDYRVELRPQGDGVTGACDCPAFAGSGFCKHMVAVALASREAAEDEAPRADRRSEVRAWLLAQGTEALADRILRLAERDLALFDEIERDMADASEDDRALISRYRAAIDAATDAMGPIDYWGAGAYADEVGRMVVRLEALLEAGRPTPVLRLAEFLLDRLDDAFESIDDSDGEVGGVVRQAAELHLRACRLARPDPAELAPWLFEREVDGCWNGFEGAAGIYADVLGAGGLAKFRELAQAAWTARRPRGAATPDIGHHALKGMLDAFARQDGDIEARIALRTSDLSHPGAYLEIADICVEAGRDADATPKKAVAAAGPCPLSTSLVRFSRSTDKRPGSSWSSSSSGSGASAISCFHLRASAMRGFPATLATPSSSAWSFAITAHLRTSARAGLSVPSASLSLVFRKRG